MQPTGNDGLVVFRISLNLFLLVILLWLCIAIGSEIHWEKPHRGALQCDLEGTYAGRVYDLVLATRLCLRWGGVTCTVRFYVRPRVNSLSKKFSCWLWPYPAVDCVWGGVGGRKFWGTSRNQEHPRGQAAWKCGCAACDTSNWILPTTTWAWKRNMSPNKICNSLESREIRPRHLLPIELVHKKMSGIWTG